MSINSVFFIAISLFLRDLSLFYSNYHDTAPESLFTLFILLISKLMLILIFILQLLTSLQLLCTDYLAYWKTFQIYLSNLEYFPILISFRFINQHDYFDKFILKFLTILFFVKVIFISFIVLYYLQSFLFSFNYIPISIFYAFHQE